MANTAEQPRERFTNFTPYEMKKGEEYMSAEMLQHFFFSGIADQVQL